MIFEFLSSSISSQVTGKRDPCERAVAAGAALLTETGAAREEALVEVVVVDGDGLHQGRAHTGHLLAESVPGEGGTSRSAGTPDLQSVEGEQTDK